MAAYYGLMVESASFLGAERREAEQQMLEVLNFETQLANVSYHHHQSYFNSNLLLECLSTAED